MKTARPTLMGAAGTPSSTATGAITGSPPAFGGLAMPIAGTAATQGVPTTDMGANPAGFCNQDVDVVFSLDVSGSMTPSLTKLVDEIGHVDEALRTKNLPGPPHYGLVIFVDDVMIMNNGEPYATLDMLKAEVTQQANLTSGNSGRQIDPNGFNPDWPENSLDSLYLAATQFKWRPAASTLRIVFHITDASFWDGMSISSGSDAEMPFGIQPTSQHRYAEVVQALRMNQVWVNAFAAKTGGPPDGMPAPASHGQFRGVSVNVGIGFFEPYMGMDSIPKATGGAVWDLDDVYDGKLSLGAPIEMSIEARQCVMYPD